MSKRPRVGEDYQAKVPEFVEATIAYPVSTQSVEVQTNFNSWSAVEGQMELELQQMLSRHNEIVEKEMRREFPTFDIANPDLLSRMADRSKMMRQHLSEHYKDMKLALKMIQVHRDTFYGIKYMCETSSREPIRDPYLYKFMRELCTFSIPFFVPLNEFKEAYFAYRKMKDAERCRWNKEHYHSTFQQAGIYIEKGLRTYNNKPYTGEFVMGLKLKEGQP